MQEFDDEDSIDNKENQERQEVIRELREKKGGLLSTIKEEEGNNIGSMIYKNTEGSKEEGSMPRIKEEDSIVQDKTVSNEKNPFEV